MTPDRPSSKEATSCEVRLSGADHDITLQPGDHVAFYANRVDITVSHSDDD